MKWSDEFEEVRNKFVGVGQSVHKDLYHSWLHREFSQEAWDALAENGFFEAIVKYGNRKGVAWLGAALQGFSYGSQDAGFNFSTIAQAGMAIHLLHKYGESKLKLKYLKLLMSGNKIAAFCVTDRKSGGTNAYKPTCELTQEENACYLNGEKWHVTNAQKADVLFVWCVDSKSGSLMCVVVDRNASGVQVGESLKPSGARTSPVAPLRFENVLVPSQNVFNFSKVKKTGRSVLEETLIVERLLSCYPALGVIEVAIKKAMGFIKERKFDGVRLMEKQYVQGQIFEAQRSFNIISALAYVSLDKYQQGEDVTLEASQLKITAVEEATKAINACRRLCGSYGDQEEAQYIMWLNDAASSEHAGGASIAHISIVFRETLRLHRETLPLLIDSRKPWSEEDVFIPMTFSKAV